MKCNSCSYEVNDGAKFCTNCGADMSAAVSCRTCGAVNDKAAGFCTDCGKSLKAPEPVHSTSGTKISSDDFIFALTEEVVATKSAANVATPWGYFMVVLQDGFVSTQACRQLKAEFDRNEKTGNFVSRAWNAFGNWIGGGGNGSKKPAQVSGKSQVYLVMDAQNTPLISYARPTPVTGYPDAQLKFEFWLADSAAAETGAPLADSNDLGLFFQRCVGARASLTVHEFREISVQQVEKLMPGFNLDSFISDPPSAQLVAEQLRKVTGISAKCYFTLGKVEERIQLDISRGPIRCPDDSCGKLFLKPLKFCTECGTSMQGLDMDGSQDHLRAKMGGSYLLSKEGEIVTLKLSMLINRGTPLAGAAGGTSISVEIDDDFRGNVAQQVVEFLGPDIRNKTLPDLMQPEILDSLSQKLSAHLMKQFRGFITGFNVIDLRSATEDWFFQSEALIKEELRILDAQKEQLRIDNAQIDLQEAAFAVALRKLRQDDNEALQKRQAALEARLAETELEVQEYELETKTDLRKESVDDDAARVRLERDSARRDQERSVNRKESREDRLDEVEGLDHDQGLEKKMVKHDLDLADLVGDAESRSKRRDISDESFAAEEQIRLRAKELQDVRSLEDNLEINKLKALADIDAGLEQQKNEFELSKIQNLKGLSAQELLAMQAAELAKTAGGGEATANLIKAIADSQASTAGAGLKDEMYKQMLEVQKASMESAIQAHKEASQVAQSTNEKSMDAMSKVAEKAAGAVNTSVAVKLGADTADKASKTQTCANPDCGHSWPLDKPVKFCDKCGTATSK
jgi:hypothetical protein